MIDLSIIIPYYNTPDYTEELLNMLTPQVDRIKLNVEIIVVDDGSKKPFVYADKQIVTIYRQDNAGVSAARNRGIEEAKGRYISFIDSDDLVAVNYVEKVLKAIETEPEAVYISWRTLGSGWKYACNLSMTEFPAWNLCVWNRILRRDIIGDVRFNEKKKVAEDADFLHQLKINKVERITDYLYFYRTGHESLSKRYQSGELDFERVVFHYPTITKDMTWLVEEVKRVNEEGEAIIITEKNEIPELKNYAMILLSPVNYIAGTKLQGEPLPGFKLIPKPIKTQVVVYIAKTLKIGGVETWIYNFVSHMSKYYDIIVAYTEEMSGEQILRLSEIVQVVKILNRPIICDTVLNMRITDEIPEKIKAKNIIQVCHTCKMKEWKIQPNHDELIFVSETAKKSFNQDGKVIHNLTLSEKKKALLLVTASRFTFEKGAERMLKLAEAFRRDNIPFVWLIFTNADIKLTDGMVKLPPTLDVKAYIQKADYLVQLSDKEAFCYSIVEAMEAGTPVLTTPIEVLDEIKFKEGETGFIIPFDVSKVPTKEILEGLPPFDYKWDNKKIVNQWREVLGNTKPTGDYLKQKPFVKVLIIEDYGDIELGRNVRTGEEITMRRDRARTIIMAGKAIEI